MEGEFLKIRFSESTGRMVQGAADGSESDGWIGEQGFAVRNVLGARVGGEELLECLHEFRITVAGGSSSNILGASPSSSFTWNTSLGSP